MSQLRQSSVAFDRHRAGAWEHPSGSFFGFAFKHPIDALPSQGGVNMLLAKARAFLSQGPQRPQSGCRTVAGALLVKPTTSFSLRG